MRVLIAALFVVGGLLAAVAALSAFDIFNRAPPWVVGIGLAFFMLVLSCAALVLFNARGSDPFGRKTPEEYLRHLEALGLITAMDFQAQRWFGIEEAEDEGLHYFIELVDGRVLYLSGQYLLHYEPITDDPEFNQARRFPCTDFTVRSHKTEGYVADIECRGVVIEPEFMAPPVTSRRWRSIGAPMDGQVMADRPYDLLKELLFEGSSQHANGHIRDRK